MPKPIRASLCASFFLATALAAQTSGPHAAPSGRRTPLRGSLEQRLTTLLDQPPFGRTHWGLYVIDDRGQARFQHDADRLAVPASNTKLIVTATATVLLPADYRVRTSLYATGALQDGVLHGDLVMYGRGDPTFSQRCFSVDTLAAGMCDSAMTVMNAIADSLWSRGVRRVTGKLVGDGSYFEPTLTHWNWGSFDLNWWYAAPVSGLGFHDNSVDFHIAPGAAVDQPPAVTWTPDLSLFTFENRARTVPAERASRRRANASRIASLLADAPAATRPTMSDSSIRVP